MITVGELVDRTQRDFLEPPNEQWTRTALTSSVDSSTTTWPIDLVLLSVEEQNLLGPGVLLEAGSEQVSVVSLSGSTLTVRRGMRGTTAAAHADDTDVLIAPPYTRTTIFDAVAHGIADLNPPLYRKTPYEADLDSDQLLTLPASTESVTRVRRQSDFHVFDFDDLGEWDGSRTVRVPGGCKNDTMIVTLRRGFDYPTNESQSLYQLGVRDEWAQIIVVSAAAQLISAKPMSVAWQEFVSAQLRTESYPVETPGRIRDSLLRYHQYLLDRAAIAQLQRDPPTQVYQADR